jgi:hypothetical protein
MYISATPRIRVCAPSSRGYYRIRATRWPSTSSEHPRKSIGDGKMGRTATSGIQLNPQSGTSRCVVRALRFLRSGAIETPISSARPDNSFLLAWRYHQQEHSLVGRSAIEYQHHLRTAGNHSLKRGSKTDSRDILSRRACGASRLRRRFFWKDACSF